jgi:hypothetical protein
MPQMTNQTGEGVEPAFNTRMHTQVMRENE